MLYTRGKLKIILTFVVLFLVICALLLLVYFKGNTTYEVTFDLDGGTLISGSVKQTVTRGQDAEPPIVVKSGSYLHSWSASYRRVTKDLVVKAVWEYETTPGIIYSSSSNSNFTEIIDSYELIKGDVYLGAFHDGKIVLGIGENAFANRVRITKVYLLNGLMCIGKGAFSGCTYLAEIEIPGTVTHIRDEAFRNCFTLKNLTFNQGLAEIGAGAFENCTSLKEIEIPKSVVTIEDGAFSGCTSLEKVVLHEGLLELGADAFKNCTSLKEIVLPANLERIDANAFSGCDDLTITVTHAEGKKYDQWYSGWNGSATVVWPDEIGPDGPQLEGSRPVFPPFRPPQKFEPNLDFSLPESKLESAEKDNSLLNKDPLGLTNDLKTRGQ